MVDNGPGPHKLRHKYKAPRRLLDPPLRHDYRSVAGMLQLKPGKRVQLATARGALFFAHVNHGKLDMNGMPLIALPWDMWIAEEDWGYNRRLKNNHHIAGYCRALDDWACIYLGLPPPSDNGGGPPK